MSIAPIIWMNAGETSGDLHGQLLARALREERPDARILGMAGPAMREEGVEARLETEALSVMGFTEVLAHLPKILGLLRTLKEELTKTRPDVVVVIDAPDFHFRVARIAGSLGIPVVYYISPKLWAWREGRVKFLRRHVSRLISILPFEVEFYARHGMNIDYVGHPLLDSIRTQEILETKPRANRIGILPGSRKREITSLLPVFSRTAALLSARYPELEFVLPVAPGMDRDLITKCWACETPVTLADSSSRYELMRSCRAIMAASGTATLETALLGTPTAVAYKFSQLTYLLGRLLVKVPFISLPNLILDKSVFPEFLQHDANPSALAAAMAQWIEDTPARARVLEQLDILPGLLGNGGAASRAAKIVLETMRKP
ncbi:MAG: lipid-A-disaccharide synthase [Desulfomicrobium sp.]|nr:lipid-A-disaccharide synthase [Pseudomonadota bacterium]MBV1714234.1 lipid-A-disaccharide synthase [Desulfomicrobium sp.]MBU4570973.1 lipid-A-disaccharide synthase [Pseudomonadota bacterium]MBU4594591.1 lipid-A-disaccharide synthase [Pseudomonadota bacterium]MBV1721780.1 lipid-A-disaccharide synthase [Desulfomicrobium sp.]